jgi:hypothetical protein
VESPAPVCSPSHLKKHQEIAKLADLLDAYHGDFLMMQKLVEKLETTTGRSARKSLIEKAEGTIELFKSISLPRTIKSMKARWKACNPESWWPEDEDAPLRSQVTAMLTHLIDTLPEARVPKGDKFMTALVDHVMDLTPLFVELESVCWQLQKKQKFTLMISDVIEALEEQKKLWDRRSDVVFGIEENYDDLCNAVAVAKEDEAKAKAEEEAAAERKAAEAKAAAERYAAKWRRKKVVGDRVYNSAAGAGTVIAIEGTYTYESGAIEPVCCVRFDAPFTTKQYPEARHEHNVRQGYLEILLPGDKGFILGERRL